MVRRAITFWMLPMTMARVNMKLALVAWMKSLAIMTQPLPSKMRRTAITSLVQAACTNSLATMIQKPRLQTTLHASLERVRVARIRQPVTITQRLLLMTAVATTHASVVKMRRRAITVRL